MKIKNSLLLKTALVLVYPTFSSHVYAEHLDAGTVEMVKKPAPQADMVNAHTVGDTAKLLSDEAGVSFYRAGGVSSLPVLHGLADDRIRIKVDGMDLIASCANHMNPPLSYIAPSNVEAINVYAGISPVSLGGDSIAGSIVFHSATPAFANAGEALVYNASLNTFYKSNQDARGVNTSLSVASDTMYLRYTGSIVDTNNYHAGGDFKPAGLAATGKGWLDGDEVGSSAYRAINHALAWGLQRENHLFEFKLGVQDIPKQGFVNQRMDMTGNDANQYNFTYQGRYGWGVLEAQAYYERVRHRMQFGEDKQYWYQMGAAPGMPMDTLGKTTGLKVKGTLDVSDRDVLRVGAEYQRYRLDDYWEPSGNTMMMGPNTFWNINNGQRDRYAMFAELDRQWNHHWFTQVGLRAAMVKMDADDVQGYNNSTMPMGMMGTMAAYGMAANQFNAADRSTTYHHIDMTLLARYTPNETASYEAGYAIKTRAPSVYERFAWSDTNTMVMNMNNWVGDGNGYVGNLNLQPETAHTVSMTGKWHDASRQHWQVSVTPYLTYVDDYIDAVTCASVGKTCMMRPDGFVNLSLDNQSARLWGLDVKANTLLSQGGRFGRINLTGLINYARGINTETDDDLYNIMPLNAKLGLEHKAGAWQNRLELQMVAAKNHVQAIRKELETSGYSLVNVYTRYDWKNVRVNFGIENLFDKQYDDPLGGAYLGQGATMGKGVMHGIQVPGMGRSINVGLTLFY